MSGWKAEDAKAVNEFEQKIRNLITCKTNYNDIRT
jgi:hypothetical protein